MLNISFQKLFFEIATVMAIFAIMILGKVILIPMGFAMLFAFILYPLCKKLERWGTNYIFAAFLSLFLTVLILAGGIALFSSQLIHLSSELTNFKEKIMEGFTELTLYVNNNINMVPDLDDDELLNRSKQWMSESTGSLLSKTFSGTATFLGGFLMTVIFTFLILIYRKGLVRAIASFAPEGKRDRIKMMLGSVQKVGQKYLSGTLIVMVIIGFGNSIGLWIIGIDDPFLFGFIGAVLSVIPYVGTVSGAILPTLYALVVNDSLLMAAAVAGLYWFVQLVSDNFLGPKIIGSSVHVNALVAIISLIVGAAVWGIAGMVLFLPFAAMLKVVCEEYEELKPVALLIGDENFQERSKEIRWVRKLKERMPEWMKKKPEKMPSLRRRKTTSKKKKTDTEPLKEE